MATSAHSEFLEGYLHYDYTRSQSQQNNPPMESKPSHLQASAMTAVDHPHLGSPQSSPQAGPRPHDMGQGLTAPRETEYATVSQAAPYFAMAVTYSSQAKSGQFGASQSLGYSQSYAPPPVGRPAYLNQQFTLNFVPTAVTAPGHQQPPGLDEENNKKPFYVNSKQFHRILKRRDDRQRLEEQCGYQGRRPFINKSRRNHAMKRPRGPHGRFLTADEIAKIEGEKGRNAGDGGVAGRVDDAQGLSRGV